MSTSIALISRFYNNISDRLPMTELRHQAEQIGLHDPVTYQSTGNLIFDSDASPASIEEDLTFAIWTCGYDVDVFVRTSVELAAIVAANPLRNADFHPSRLRVVFLERAPDQAERQLLLDTNWGDNDAWMFERELFVYLRAPEESKVFSHLKWFEERTGIASTARNWNTVAILHRMCQERASAT